MPCEEFCRRRDDAAISLLRYFLYLERLPIVILSVRRRIPHLKFKSQISNLKTTSLFCRCEEDRRRRDDAAISLLRYFLYLERLPIVILSVRRRTPVKSQISNLKSQNDILFLSLRGGPPKAGRRGNLRIVVIRGRDCFVSRFAPSSQ